MKKNRRPGPGPNLKLESGGAEEGRIQLSKNRINLLSFSRKKLLGAVFCGEGEDGSGDPTLSSVTGRYLNLLQ